MNSTVSNDERLLRSMHNATKMNYSKQDKGIFGEFMVRRLVGDRHCRKGTLTFRMGCCPCESAAIPFGSCCGVTALPKPRSCWVGIFCGTCCMNALEGLSSLCCIPFAKTFPGPLGAPKVAGGGFGPAPAPRFARMPFGPCSVAGTLEATGCWSGIEPVWFSSVD